MTASRSSSTRKPAFSVLTRSQTTTSASRLGESSLVLIEMRPGGTSCGGSSTIFSSSIRFCSLYPVMIRIRPHAYESMMAFAVFLPLPLRPTLSKGSALYDLAEESGAVAASLATSSVMYRILLLIEWLFYYGEQLGIYRLESEEIDGSKRNDLHLPFGSSYASCRSL